AAAAAKEATAAREQALRTRDAAVLAQSQYLADLSLQETERNNPVNGLLLALDALPDKDSDDPIARNRASWPPAEMSLELARRAIRERKVLSRPSLTGSLALSHDGNRLVSVDVDSSVRVYDLTSHQEAVLFKIGFRVVAAALAQGAARMIA